MNIFFSPIGIGCSIVALTGGAFLLAFLECSGTFAPEDHKLHQLELQFKKQIRYYLIEFKDQNGRQSCWARRSKKARGFFIPHAVYLYDNDL